LPLQLCDRNRRWVIVQTVAVLRFPFIVMDFIAVRALVHRGDFWLTTFGGGRPELVDLPAFAAPVHDSRGDGSTHDSIISKGFGVANILVRFD
jgi:hypothetical protein